MRSQSRRLPPDHGSRTAEPLISEAVTVDESAQREHQWRMLKQREAKLDAGRAAFGATAGTDRASRIARHSSCDWPPPRSGTNSCRTIVRSIAERVDEARQRLTDHYRLANESLAQRTDELHRMRQELHEQEQRLRVSAATCSSGSTAATTKSKPARRDLILRERELDRTGGRV